VWIAALELSAAAVRSPSPQAYGTGRATWPARTPRPSWRGWTGSGTPALAHGAFPRRL